MSTRIKELQAKLRKQKGGDQIAVGMKLGNVNFLGNSRRVRSKTVGENSLLNTLIMNKPVIANRRRHKSCQLTITDLEGIDEPFDISFSTSNVSAVEHSQTPIANKQPASSPEPAMKRKSLPMVERNTVCTENRNSTEPDTKTIEMIKNETNMKHIRLFAPVEEYLLSKKGENYKGFVITDILKNNRYGKSLQAIGIENGWKLKQVGSGIGNLNNISYFDIKKQLENEYRKSRENRDGYELQFEKICLKTEENNINKKEKIVGQHFVSGAKSIPLRKKKSVVRKIPKVNSCEIVRCGSGWKTIRMFGEYTKYFETVVGENNKGMKIVKIHDERFEAFGVEVGWHLQKLGKKNILKKGYRMLNLLLISEGNSAHDGYEITFFSNENSNQASESSVTSSVDSSKSTKRKKPGSDETIDQAIALKKRKML